MAQYCLKCGGPLGPNGLCPRCDTWTGNGGPAGEQHPDAKRTGDGKKRKSRKKLLLACIAFLVLALAILVLLQVTKVVNIPCLAWLIGANDQDGPREIPSEALERTETDDYMDALGTVVDKTSAKSSSTVHTEAEATVSFAERGFTQYPITTAYTMEGAQEQQEEISDSSATEHPFYQTYYITDSEVIWVVMEVNGRMFANPVTYNASEGWDVRRIVSESNTIFSYDGATNRFYEIIPDRSEAIVKTVGRIDAQTLESLSAREVYE